MNKWYDYLWLLVIAQLILGLFNILFGLIGLMFFIVPLYFAVFKGNKKYCEKYCGRGQLYELLGKDSSRYKNNPKWMKNKVFLYGFMVLFFGSFILMLVHAFLVFKGWPLSEKIIMFWSFNFPWNWAHNTNVPAWLTQFAYGFYGLSASIIILGLIMMYFFKPRSWCVICPMSTATKCICKYKNRKEIQEYEKKQDRQ